MLLPIFSHSEKINNKKLEKTSRAYQKRGYKKGVKLEPLNVLEEHSFRKMLHGTYSHDLLEIFPKSIFFIITKAHGSQRHCASFPGIICTSNRIWHLSTCCWSGEYVHCKNFEITATLTNT